MSTKLKTVMKELALGELSALAQGNLPLGRIQDDRQEQVVHFINEALQTLYAKFVLKEEEVIVDLKDGKTDYLLTSMQAKTKNPNGYIRDTVERPFTDDVLRVLSVTADNGTRLPLNDEGAEHSVFTLRPDMVQVPCSENWDAVSVIYQAAHPKMVVTQMDGVIELPLSLAQALRSYVAYKVFSSVGTQEAKQSAMEHLSHYQGIVTEVEKTDVISISRGTTTCKFIQKGFV